MQGVEALGKDIVETEQGGSIVFRQEIVYQLESIFIIEYSKVADDIGVVDVVPAECHRLVEYGESVAHCTVRFLGNYMKRFIVYGNPFLLRYCAEIAHHVGDPYAVEVVCLATGKDGGQDLVFFGGAKDEDGISRRFFKSLQEGVERRLAEHVDLIDYVDAVVADLRRDLHFFHQGLDVFDTVVGGSVEFVDAV